MIAPPSPSKGNRPFPVAGSNATFEVAGRYLVETARLARRRRARLLFPLAKVVKEERELEGSGALLEK
jgi:hypothetical protein